jgi:hypothetical protein
MIVGLLGFIGSGKGTAGDILKDMGFTPISFAKGVKDVTAEMFGWPRHLLEGDTQHSRDWREKPDKFWSYEFGKEFTPRLALQLMGTEVGRNVFHKDFWILKLKNYIDNSPEQNYVVTDVRFQNEIDFISNYGGVLIEIQREIKPHWYNIAVKANHGDFKAESFMKNNVQVHESEWRWIGGQIDYVIDNVGTVNELKKKLLGCLTKSFGSNTINELTKGVFNETI